MLHQLFQQRIKEERQARSMTQAQIAKALGMSQPCYADIESGPNEPRLSTIEKIAKFFEMDASELLCEKILA